MGFGVPLDAWFRGELRDYMRDLLLAPDARYRACCRAAFVERLVARHLAGERQPRPAALVPHLLRALAAAAARMDEASHVA